MTDSRCAAPESTRKSRLRGTVAHPSRRHVASSLSAPAASASARAAYVRCTRSLSSSRQKLRRAADPSVLRISTSARVRRAACLANPFRCGRVSQRRICRARAAVFPAAERKESGLNQAPFSGLTVPTGCRRRKDLPAVRGYRAVKCPISASSSASRSVRASSCRGKTTEQA